jgi:hypothetical protein
MDHPEGADKPGDIRLDFDRRVRLKFHGSKISSDGGLLLFRELDEVLGLHDLAGGLLRDTRTGHNRLHSFVGLLRQSVFGRLAGYEDVNDAERLAFDPVSAIKPERKWLGWSVHTCADHPRIRVSPVAGTRNRSQLVHLMPEPRSGVAKRLDRCAERRQHGVDGVLLGECRPEYLRAVKLLCYCVRLGI